MTKQIGYLTFSLDETNGLGRYSIEVLKRVAARGYRCIVCVPRRDHVDAQLEADPNVVVHRVLPDHYLLHRRWANALSASRLTHYFRGCDMLHSIFDFPHVELAQRIARRLGVPYVSSAHGTFSIAPLHDRRYRNRLAAAFGGAEHVMAVSHYTLRGIESQIPLEGGVVIPPGIDRDEFAGGRPGARSNSTFQVLGVGALKSRKGWDLLIEAAALVRDLDPPIHVTIVGGDAGSETGRRLLAQAESLGIRDRIELAGSVSDERLKELYAGAHLFAMPSRSDHKMVEGFGLVYLEAGAFGVPQLGCLDTGAEEPIVAAETGYLVPQEDPPAIAAAIRELHGDPELHARMSTLAWERAGALTWDRMVDRIVEIGYAPLLTA